MIGPRADAGVFRVDGPWLAIMAIRGIAGRVGEWWGSFVGYSVDDVADAYGNLAVRLLGADK